MVKSTQNISGNDATAALDGPAVILSNYILVGDITNSIPEPSSLSLFWLC